MSAILDSQLSSIATTPEYDLSNNAVGVHTRHIRYYEDFHQLANAESSAAKLLEVIAHAKHIASNPSTDAAVALAALRRKATAHLLLNQAKRALSTGEQMIRLRFDWPYGHLIKADALLALGHLSAALSTYQLALQLMPQKDPTFDFGRSEVIQHTKALAHSMVAKSCLIMTVAHQCEITAVAGWPLAAARRGPCRGHRQHHTSARELQKSVDCSVNDALEAISRDGAVSHVQLHGELSIDNRLSGAGAANSEGNRSALNTAEGNTLDQLLADKMRPKLVTSNVRPSSSTSAADHSHRGVERRRKSASTAANASACGEFLSTLDTAVSSNTYCNGLRTSTSDFELKTHTSGWQASLCRSPLPSSCAEGEPELEAGAGATMRRPHSDTTHVLHMRQQMSTQASTLSSEAASSRNPLWSSLLMHNDKQQSFMATGDLEGTVKLWDVTSLECVNELKGHCDGITCLVFAKRLRKGCVLLLASADAEGAVFVWACDLEGGLLESVQLNGHANRIVAMHFVHGGRRLITASVDTTVLLWNIGAGACEARLEGHRRAVTAMDCLSIKSAIAIATCSSNGAWRLWDLDMRQTVLEGRQVGACSHIRFSTTIATLNPPRPLLVTCHWNAGKGGRSQASVHLWDVFALTPSSSTQQPCHSFTSVARGQISDIAFTVDETHKPLMAVASSSGALIIYDLAARSVLTHLTEVHITAEEQVPPIHSVVYSDDGHFLITCGGDGNIKVWSVADMEVLLTLCGHASEVMKMCTLGAGRLLASCSETGELAFWDLRYAQQLSGSSTFLMAPPARSHVGEA
jgi:WD40 repeat protein